MVAQLSEIQSYLQWPKPLCDLAVGPSDIKECVAKTHTTYLFSLYSSFNTGVVVEVIRHLSWLMNHLEVLTNTLMIYSYNRRKKTEIIWTFMNTWPENTVLLRLTKKCLQQFVLFVNNGNFVFLGHGRDLYVNWKGWNSLENHLHALTPTPWLLSVRTGVKWQRFSC